MVHLLRVLLSKICLIIKVSAVLSPHLLETSLACCGNTPQRFPYLVGSEKIGIKHQQIVSTRYKRGWVLQWKSREISCKLGDRTEDVFIIRYILESRTNRKYPFSHYSFCANQIHHAVTDKYISDVFPDPTTTTVASCNIPKIVIIDVKRVEQLLLLSLQTAWHALHIIPESSYLSDIKWN